MRIRCDGAKCFVTEIERLASGAINYFTAKFTFDNAWALFTEANQLYAVFEGSDVIIISNLIYNTETQSYDCEIPWQTMTQEGELYVGAIGHITTPEVKILTTNMAFAYRIPKGAATVGDNISDPSGLLLNILDAADNVQANLTKSNIAISRWPIIDSDTQNWFRWDTLTEKYVDTGTSAVGRDLTILGHYDTYSLLEGGVTSPNIGDIYTVGTVSPYTLYIYDGILNSWKDYGPLLSGGSGSSDGMVNHDELEAHEASLLMHKPAVDCTVIGKASVEGYANTVGTETPGGIVYQYYEDMTNPIVPTATPNEYIITFSGVRPDVIVGETVDFETLLDGATTGVIVSVDTQTITLTCLDTLAADDNILYALILYRPIDTYAHAEGYKNTATSLATHAEGRGNLVCVGINAKIIDFIPPNKFVLTDASNFNVNDVVQLVYNVGLPKGKE